MADPDLNALSLKELRQVQKDVARAELAPSGKSGAKAPKYCHPEDPRLTWSGRGRKPHWFTEAIAAGHDPDDLLIARRG
jgi:DNA-binding protein H-NS